MLLCNAYCAYAAWRSYGEAVLVTWSGVPMEAVHRKCTALQWLFDSGPKVPHSATSKMCKVLS